MAITAIHHGLARVCLGDRRPAKFLTPKATAVRESLAEHQLKNDHSLPDLLSPARPYTGIAGKLCNAAESFITNFIDNRVERPRRSDPKIQLADNFAPVPSEVPPQACTRVRGQIPDCLDGGVYIRNGANPLFEPVGGYHYFDGHGMLHAVKFVDGVPYYCCRYTKTNRYEHELAAGRSLFPNPIGDIYGVPGIARLALFGMRVALGVVDVASGMGTANAGLVYHNGTLLAMSEDDMPYAIRICDDGDLETVGRLAFEGENQLTSPMTAHPKLDPRIGELLSYSYNVFSKPFLKYFKVSAEGVKSKDVPIPLSEPVLMHDFAVTENFVVFPDTQIVFRFQDLFLRRGSAVVCDETKVPRFGVLPRKAEDTSDLKWFDVPALSALHLVNGWDEDDGQTIVVIAAKLSSLSKMFDDPASVHNTICRVRLDLATGLATTEQISAAVLELGQVDHRFITRKTRYGYFSIYGPWPKFSGIAKLDFNAPTCCNVTTISDEDLKHDPAVVAWRKFGPGRFGSEAFFVPRDENAEEDDGFLLCYVHDEITGISELLIMNASSPELEVVASIELPSRVPYGFHGQQPVYYISISQCLACHRSQRVQLQSECKLPKVFQACASNRHKMDHRPLNPTTLFDKSINHDEHHSRYSKPFSHDGRPNISKHLKPKYTHYSCKEAHPVGQSDTNRQFRRRFSR